MHMLTNSPSGYFYFEWTSHPIKQNYVHINLWNDHCFVDNNHLLILLEVNYLPLVGIDDSPALIRENDYLVYQGVQPNVWW